MLSPLRLQQPFSDWIKWKCPSKSDEWMSYIFLYFFSFQTILSPKNSFIDSHLRTVCPWIDRLANPGWGYPHPDSVIERKIDLSPTLRKTLSGSDLHQIRIGACLKSGSGPNYTTPDPQPCSWCLPFDGFYIWRLYVFVYLLTARTFPSHTSVKNSSILFYVFVYIKE